MAEGEEADFFMGRKADVSRFALSNPKLGLEQVSCVAVQKSASFPRQVPNADFLNQSHI